MSATTLTLTRPDDWHVHLRDGLALQAVLPDTALRFARAIVMPNLKTPVTTTERALAYRARIMAALPVGLDFTPLMTLYLTDNTSATEIQTAKESGMVQAVKYYPAGATTNSDSGVTAIEHCYPALAAMEECGMPLLVHGEVTDAEVDVFDREAVFIERILIPVHTRFPRLKIVFEHITTRQAVEFVQAASAQIGATITAHHLLYNRNAMFKGGVRPDWYCLPVLKRETHRLALVAAATSGNPKFFLGTDSAPHPRSAKYSACGCAGMYTAHAALELYAEAFEQANALDKLEAFASFHGADFYGLARNTSTLTLKKTAWQAPAEIAMGEDVLIPLRANEFLSWQIAS